MYTFLWTSPEKSNITTAMKITHYLILAGIVPANAALLADFDGNGLDYTEAAFRGAAAPAGAVVADGPTGSYYHLLDGATGNAGNILVLIDGNTRGKVGKKGEVIDSLIINSDFNN